MISIRTFYLRLKGLFQKKQVENDLAEELQFHLQKEIRKNVEAGMTSEEARYAALRTFGGVDQIKEDCRDVRRTRAIEDLWRDARYGIRLALKNPSFTIVTVITLALGIGANTALFSVVNAELIRELPYREPGRLVYVSEYWPHEPSMRAVPSPDFGHWQAQARLFDGLAGYGRGGSFNLTGTGVPQRVEGVMVTADFLTLLGVQPALGRNFQRDEDHLGATHVVLLSHGFWQRYFESSPSVIGKAVTLDGESYAIVGILPASFRLPDNAFQVDLLVPMVLPPNPNWQDRDLRLLRVIARLKPNTTARELQAEFSSIVSSRVSEETPQFARMRKDMQVQVTSLRDHLSRDQRPFLLILLGMVAMVLMIACVNVANLQIARLVSRQREMALRLALGAGSVRLVRQLFTESLFLSMLGGVAGLAVGYWGLYGLRRFMPTSFPQLDTVRIDHVVLAFTLVISVLTGILFGLGPVLAVFKTDLNESLKENSLRAVSVDHHHRLQGVLVSAQIAMAVVLLSGSGLLVRSFLHLTAVNPGFDPHGLLTARVSLPSAKYAKAEAQSAFFSRLLELAQAVPGVQSAALAGGLPLVGWWGTVSTVVQGRPLPPPGAAPATPYTQVSSNYFRALSIPLMRGRFFDEREGGTSPQVAIVNQAFVRLFFPDEDPVGRHIKTGATTGPWREIVGVVGNVKQQGLADEESAEIYVPYLQNPCSEMILVLKSGLPTALADDTARIVQAVDPDQPLYEVATMVQRLSDSLSGPRFNMLLVGVFAVLALVLAAIGIYGVIVYFVSRRTHEIGIRMALGATPQTVTALVLLQTSWLIGAGVTIGLVAALALTRVMAGLLYVVKPTDPLTFAIVSLLLVAIALLASYIPARRATKIDPMVALRCE
jgi:predicted permease